MEELLKKLYLEDTDLAIHFNDCIEEFEFRFRRGKNNVLRSLTIADILHTGRAADKLINKITDDALSELYRMEEQ